MKNCKISNPKTTNIYTYPFYKQRTTTRSLRTECKTLLLPSSSMRNSCDSCNTFNCSLNSIQKLGRPWKKIKTTNLLERRNCQPSKWRSKFASSLNISKRKKTMKWLKNFMKRNSRNLSVMPSIRPGSWIKKYRFSNTRPKSNRTQNTRRSTRLLKVDRFNLFKHSLFPNQTRAKWSIVIGINAHSFQSFLKSI